MIRQLSMNGLRFHTPEYVGEVNAFSEISGQSHSIEFVVTEESLVEMESPSIGAEFSGVEVDVVGSVKGIPLAIYCTYRGREVPFPLRQPKTKLCGVVELNLAEVASRFGKVKFGRYVDALRLFIEEESTGKSWVYHPRFEGARNKADHDMSLWLAQQKPPEDDYDWYSDDDFVLESGKIELPPASEKVPRNYKCVICGSQWFGESRKCHCCNTHLYTTESDGTEK